MARKIYAMESNIIGREKEITELKRYLASGRAEFVALYGRRRVGKTFLADELLGEYKIFSVTGILEAENDMQLDSFYNALRFAGYKGERPNKWMDSFFELERLLESKIKKGKRCVVFIDELPCFDIPGTGFVQAFGHFWNSWACKHSEIMLVVCGSATSWMITNLIDSHGGLHNRITHEMHIRPFSLSETEKYLKYNGCHWDRLSVLQTYMIMGGIPFYLNLLDSNKSLAQNIDSLFFADDGDLREEYNRLFSSLFKQPEPYLSIIRLLAESNKGMTRNELAEALKSDNGHLSACLENLQRCDFIRSYRTYSKYTKYKKNGAIYQLIDFYVMFYNTFVVKGTNDEFFWEHHLNTPTINNWLGLTFERVVMAHIPNVLKAIGVDRIATEYYSWRSKESENGAQIDLIIDRADRVVNVCEIKYSQGLYSVQKDEYLKIKTRLSDFQNETGIQSSIVPTFITTNGLKENGYSSSIPISITLDELF